MIQNGPKLEIQLAIKDGYINCHVFILCTFCVMKFHVYKVQEVVKLINGVRNQYTDYWGQEGRTVAPREHKGDCGKYWLWVLVKWACHIVRIYQVVQFGYISYTSIKY